MRDKNLSDVGSGDTRESHLPLRALARIEKHSFRIPTQKIAVMVSLARRNLARSAKSYEYSRRHKN
jgi:hypothetical protein